MGAAQGASRPRRPRAAQIPPAPRRVCYVNPVDPTDAVLQRSFDKEYIVAIVPAIFTLVGLGGILLVLRGARKQRAALAGAMAAGASPGGNFVEAEEGDGPE